ncbi:MAG: DUF6785 family protein [Candidatus Bathyarchaeia archaeon]
MKGDERRIVPFPIKGFMLGVIIVIMYSIFFSYAGAHFSAYQRWGIGFAGTIGSLFLVVFVMSILGRFSRNFRMSIEDFVIAYSMILWAALSSHGEWTIMVGYNTWMIWQGFRIPAGRLYNEWLPSWIFPRTEYLSGYIEGGAVINWSIWIIPVLSNIVFLMAITLAGMFFALILRKPWIDVEKLLFPFADPAKAIIEAASGSEEKPSLLRWTASKMLYIGIIIGLLLYVPEVINHGFGITWFPVPSKLYAGRLKTFFFDFCDIIPNVAIDFTPVPWVVALFYFAPTDFLFSAWLWGFLSNYVLGPLQVYLGIIPPPPFPSIAPTVASYLGAQGPIKMAIWGGLGGFTALGLFSIGVHWRHFLKSLKCVIHPDPTYESSEPLSYRWLWIGFIICSLIVVCFLIALGIPPYAAILGFIFVYFFYLVNARLRGEGGVNVWYFVEGFGAPVSWFGRAIGLPHGPEEPGTMMFYIWTYHYIGYPYGFAASMPGVLESCRIAVDTGVNLRHLFIALLTSVFLIVVLGLILPLHAYHIWGSQKYIGNPWVRGTWQAPTAYSYASSAAPINTFGYVSIVDPQGTWVYHYIFGVALMLCFIAARALWPSFPLNVAGIAVSPASLVAGPGGWYWSLASFFLAWLAKVLVLKTGGAVLYRRSIPFVAGIAIGSSIALIIEQLSVTFRYLAAIAR